MSNTRDLIWIRGEDLERIKIGDVGVKTIELFCDNIEGVTLNGKKLLFEEDNQQINKPINSFGNLQEGAVAINFDHFTISVKMNNEFVSRIMVISRSISVGDVEFDYVLKNGSSFISGTYNLGSSVLDLINDLSVKINQFIEFEFNVRKVGKMDVNLWYRFTLWIQNEGKICRLSQTRIN